MNRDETVELFLKGREAWNAWANALLAERKALEEAGTWEARWQGPGKQVEGENRETRAWLDEALVDFTRCLFLVRGAERPIEAAGKCKQEDEGNGPVKSFQLEADRIDFDGFVFPNDVRFKGATFEGDTQFEHATFTGEAQFESAAFNGSALFNHATFTNTVWFEHATFNGEARFERATFSRTARFGSATFNGETAFISATFTNTVWFENATFNRVWFRSVTFTSSAGFKSATFIEDAYFDPVTFIGMASFENATFTAGAWFRSAAFDGSALFDRTTFISNAWFEGANFNGEARFASANFTSNAQFDNATFASGAWFESATFTSEARFNGTAFTGDVWFKSATFASDAWFDSATFTGRTWFHDATFTGRAFYLGTIFTGFAVFRGARFKQDAEFWLASFKQFATFASSRFEAEASFNAIRGERGFDMEGAVFEGVPDFIQAHFEEALRLDNLKVHGRWVVRHPWAKRKAAKGQPEKEEQEKRAETKWRRRWCAAWHFAGRLWNWSVEPAMKAWRRMKPERKARKEQPEKKNGLKEPASKWRQRWDAALHFGGRVRTWPARAAKGVLRRVRGDNSDIPARWRALKRLAIQGHDAERELEYHARELQSQRFVDDWPLPFRFWSAGVWVGVLRFWFGFVYGLFSDFGRSIFRPFLLWWATIAVFALYFLSGQPGVAERGRAAEPQGLAASAVAYVNLIPSLWREPPPCYKGAAFTPEGKMEPGKRYGLDAPMAATTNALAESFRLAIRNGSIFLDGGDDSARRTYGCLYGIQSFGGAPAPFVPGFVSDASGLQKVLSALYIFLFGLALRNMLKMK